jgi:SAM domain (Sterile alpha motif)
MQVLRDHLVKLGLGQYAQRFAENDISFSVLPDLADQDLKDIGVSLGHRRQLLREDRQSRQDRGRGYDRTLAAGAAACATQMVNNVDKCSGVAKTEQRKHGEQQ